MLISLLRFFKFLTVTVVFLASENRVSIKYFITTSVYGIYFNFKPCALIQMVFFCCFKAILKLGLTIFHRFFQFLTVEAVFLASGNGVFIKSFITTSLFRFWVNSKACTFIQMFFLMLQSITEVRC